MKKIYFLIVFSAVTAISFGQTTTEKNKVSERDKKKQERKDKLNKLIKEEEEGALIYSKQTAFGFKLNTDGWGASFEHGKYKTIRKTNLWSIELGERKSQKEEKITGPGQDIGGGFYLIGNPYIYGKQNNFYYLKAGIGQQLLIGGKGNKNGVAVTAIYGGGLSLGYLKPYYLNLALDEGNQDVKYNPTDSLKASAFLDYQKIAGASGFTKGFGEGKFVPGAYGRIALRFDYGRFNEFLSAFEVGLNAEVYSKTMPVLINNPEKRFFLNGYIAIEFGSRK